VQTKYSWDNEDQRQRSLCPIVFDPDVSGMVLSDRGGREENQDAWGWAQAADGSLILAVADGLGGHAGGRTASREAVRACLEFTQDDGFDGSDGEALEAVFDAAQDAVAAARSRHPELDSMRTTLIVLIIKGYRLRWGHIGDVRLYLVRDGAVLHQTRDQSVPQMLVDAGQIRASEIRFHPDRNRLLQTLGQTDHAPCPNFEGTANLEPGDFLVMATDGFWEWIDEAYLLHASARNAPGEALDEAEKRLLNLASAQSADFDNYTAVFLARAPRYSGKRLGGFLRSVLGDKTEK
jgi:serine/threonine protein phosphatase PrpC